MGYNFIADGSIFISLSRCCLTKSREIATKFDLTAGQSHPKVIDIFSSESSHATSY